MLLAWPKKPLVLTYAIQTCVIEQPPSKWVSAAKAAVEEDEERGKAEELRSERESRDSKYHLMCLLCDSRVYGSLETSSPLFVDESTADRPWPASVNPRSSTSSPFKHSSDSRQEKWFILATLYFTIPRPLTNASVQPKQRLYLPPGPAIGAQRSVDGAARVALSSVPTLPQGEVAPTLNLTVEPSLLVPERKLGDDAGERETPNRRTKASTLTRNIALKEYRTEGTKRGSRVVSMRIVSFVAPSSLNATSEFTTLHFNHDRDARSTIPSLNYKPLQAQFALFRGGEEVVEYAFIDTVPIERECMTGEQHLPTAIHHIISGHIQDVL
ncbi:hypothetical protein BKA70DRAFT_1576821 [Coprinopsis sp. MPI-PUGE-AT-0042]|nr:hypothetical protein BKA70DRAFT_1576821 [Coprinopsis sp. MPI-PUGE-AT-0042]